MATTTPNFGWPVPTSTDLVKDGATAIEALGDSIDASLVDLKGGTTGQVLSKNSNTDMDFVWVTDAAGDITGVTAGTGISGGGTSGTVTVTNSMATAIDAKGDLIAGTAADTFSRLAVGTDGQVLKADSTTATGLAWATTSSGSFTLITSNSFTASSAVNINDCFSSTYNQYKIIVKYTNADTGTRDARLRLRVSGSDASGADYSYGSFGQRDNGNNFTTSGANQNQFDFGRANGNAANYSSFEIITPFQTVPTVIYGGYAGHDGTTAFFNTLGGRHALSTSYTGCSIIALTGNLSGNYYVYGMSNQGVKMKITEIFTLTGEVIEREATPQEIADFEAAAEADAQAKAQEEFIAAQKAVDKAELLERLGITADEAALLLL